MVTLVRSWLVLALQLAASASAGPTVLLDCKGGGSVDCTAAFRKAAATVADAGGGTIQVPPGVFVTGGFNISSRTTLNIAPGGSITGKRSSDPFSFPAVAPLPSFGTGRDGEPARYHPIVWCINAHDVRITGGGTIDGSGDFWWHRDANALERPHLLELHNCTGVEVDHIVLKDSPFWTLHPVYSAQIHIHDVTITAPLDSPNTDGIDPDSSRDVLIENNVIGCGDDHIAIKSGFNAAGRAFAMPSQNITVRNNVFWQGRGISIGSEVSGGVSDVLIAANTLHGPSEHGIHIKTSAARGGFVRNVVIRDNVLGNITGDALLGILTSYGSKKSPDPAPVLTQIGNIRWSNITRLAGAPNIGHGAGNFGCFSQAPCANLTWSNIALNPVGSPPWRCEHVSGMAVENVSPAGLSDACKAANQLYKYK